MYGILFVFFQLSNFLAIYIQCFTMDEQRSKAVTEAFVRLYKDGLIYRLAFYNLESSVCGIFGSTSSVYFFTMCYYLWSFPILLHISSGRITLIPYAGLIVL